MQEMMRQLRLIGELQRHLIPRTIPQPSGWNIAVHYSVGSSPGGDYHDVVRLSDGRLLLLVADANESGGPGTVLVALVRATLHSCSLSSGVEHLPFCPFRDPLIQPPHLILGHLNQVLVENSLEEQYLTAFCGILSPAEGNLHYANAGHVSPRWWRASSRSLEIIRDATGLPLGMDLRATYHHKRLEIGPGDLFVLYSNGLTAAQNDQGQLFGCERLDAILCESAAQGAEAVKTAVLTRLTDFLEDRKHEEDVTLLILERLD